MTPKIDPHKRLAELDAEDTRLVEQLVGGQDELAIVRQKLTKVPRRLEQAHAATARDQGGESADEVLKAKRELDEEHMSLEAKVAGINKAREQVEKEVERLYGEHLEHFADAALAATERSRQANAAVVDALARAQSAWREAAVVWGPVCLAAERYHGMRLGRVPPASFDEAVFKFNQAAETPARPPLLKDGDRLVDTAGAEPNEAQEAAAA